MVVSLPGYIACAIVADKRKAAYVCSGSFIAVLYFWRRRKSTAMVGTRKRNQTNKEHCMIDNTVNHQFLSV